MRASALPWASPCLGGVGGVLEARPGGGGCLRPTTTTCIPQRAVCVSGGMGGDAILKRKACMGPGVGAQRRGPVPEGCLMKSIMTALAPLKSRRVCVSRGMGGERYVCDNSDFWSLPGRKS